MIVAGPNGSGKTTLVRSGLVGRILHVPALSINADYIARSMVGDRQPSEGESLRAAQLADAQLDDAIASGTDVLIATVLSSDKFKARVLAARDASFTFNFIYVTVRRSDLNLSRVDNRVRQGGHTVPPDRIVARRARSHAMFEWFARESDTTSVFDNSNAMPVLAAFKIGDMWVIRNPLLLPSDLRATIERLAAGPMA